MFDAAGASVIGIASFTDGHQAIWAALANIVKPLRAE
jgi:hypothetical protein